MKIIVELSGSMAQDIIQRERAMEPDYLDDFRMDDESLLKYFVFSALVDRFGKCGSILEQIDFQHELSGDIKVVIQ